MAADARLDPGLLTGDLALLGEGCQNRFAVIPRRTVIAAWAPRHGGLRGRFGHPSPARGGAGCARARDDQVLLLHGFNPFAPADLFWFTIGGGIDPGESPAAAAAWELLEETGMAVDPADLGELVWHRIASSASTEDVTARKKTTSYCVWSLSRSVLRAWTRSRGDSCRLPLVARRRPGDRRRGDLPSRVATAARRPDKLTT